LSDRIRATETAEFGTVISGLLGAGVDLDAAVEGSLGGVLAAIEQSYGLSLGDVQSVAERIRPGRAAALLVIEYAWAREFGNTVTRSGGKMAAQGFLTWDALMMAGKEIEAIVQAEVVVELFEPIQMEA
jgi:hypothetical protein